MSAARRRHPALLLAAALLLTVGAPWAVATQPAGAAIGTTAWQNGRFVMDTANVVRRSDIVLGRPNTDPTQHRPDPVRAARQRHPRRGEVLHFDGTAWSTVAVPSPNPGNNAGNTLTAITATGPADVWAVGEFTNPAFTNSAYALHYNGSSWAVTVLPQPAVNGPSSPVLHGVAALAPDNVWAVGENQEVPGLGITTLVEHWNGSAWSLVTSPTPGAYPALQAVAARSAGDVYAVGFNMPSANGGVQQGLILHWNGSAWSADADPTTGTFSPLYAAAAVPGAPAWAAGINSADQPLVLSHG